MSHSLFTVIDLWPRAAPIFFSRIFLEFSEIFLLLDCSIILWFSIFSIPFYKIINILLEKYLNFLLGLIHQIEPRGDIHILPQVLVHLVQRWARNLGTEESLASPLIKFTGVLSLFFQFPKQITLE